MAAVHTVKSVSRIPRLAHWQVLYEVAAGGGVRTTAHVFPESALGWRAAEYGIDPADTQTLLEIVLHEPHMVGHDHTSPDFLYNCDRATARRALLARVAEVKQRVSVTDPDGHLAAIHAAHVVDPADHAAKCAYTDHIRARGHAPGPDSQDRNNG